MVRRNRKAGPEISGCAPENFGKPGYDQIGTARLPYENRLPEHGDSAFVTISPQCAGRNDSRRRAGRQGDQARDFSTANGRAWTRRKMILNRNSEFREPCPGKFASIRGEKHIKDVCLLPSLIALRAGRAGRAGTGCSSHFFPSSVGQASPAMRSSRVWRLRMTVAVSPCTRTSAGSGREL
jgi:hypothetical protein